jgi:hypothetical protein
MSTHLASTNIDPATVDGCLENVTFRNDEPCWCACGLTTASPVPSEDL